MVHSAVALIHDVAEQSFPAKMVEQDALRPYIELCVPVDTAEYLGRCGLILAIPHGIHSEPLALSRQHFFLIHSNPPLNIFLDSHSMAARFHYDLNDEIVYRAADLRKRHDALVKRCRNKPSAVRVGELMLRFPNAEKVCKTLAAKFNYSDDRYTVVAPKGLEDILAEGDALHHCIASSDRYMERMERQESYILFLRKTSHPKIPYYTMEVEPNGTVRQIRTEYDRQNKDIEKAREFLRAWQAVVAKRLTEDDREKAQKSRDLREPEFVQMRRDQVTIHNGDLAGRLLVDVLTADLMEVA